ncbi:MAG: 2-amino-4-hydroxy-6-hydroxymethyldihydropteridine diphosphokinase [Elusimicrobiaceae bacterium]|nr:2-amino-4-hydroxy-6-hydroxymethyldihydropteridine diphosphokinase [Elusimicrobiaceae bacterium]MBP5616200.1 2-amino-4-hydroxy-6-hydroxymethyldihydropteridine diphosphokinase [Elusimicrobiaceae bacterium]
MAQAVLALGSNMGTPKENLDRAVAALSAVGTVKEVAPYIVSKPEGFSGQADFVNTVLILETSLAPIVLLKRLKELEKDLGRTPTFPNGPRVIDLDILFYDNLVLFQDDDTYPLFIPHPRLAQREFVLKPLSYILPDFIHPQLREPVYMLYRKLMKKKGTPTCHIL